MSRTKQELLALNHVLDGFIATECKGQNCEDCPIDTTICMAIVDPDGLIEVMRIEYLKKIGLWDMVIDWLREKLK